MEDNYINTYIGGFILLAFKDITKNDMFELCNNLGNRFNSYYNINNYSFSPECITEGGIVFDNFNKIDCYKTMRLYPSDKKGNRIRNLYGIIHDNIKEDWVNNTDILIYKNEYINTFLKSFKGAPEWTNEELKIFIDCFQNIDIYIYKLPTKKLLTEKTRRPKYYLDLFYK
jgi:hypothetical protein